MTHFEQLATLKLLTGSHTSAEKGLCAMEAVAWLEGLPHSDHPACTCPVIGAYVRALNDRLPDKARQRLVSYLPRLVGTVSPGHEWQRAHYLVSQSFQRAWPIVLRGLKLEQLAAEFEQIGKEWEGAALAARTARTARAARAARAAPDQIHFDMLDGVLMIGPQTSGFTQPIEPCLSGLDPQP